MQLFVPLVLLFLPVAAAAQDDPVCADRPGLGTPPCIVDGGRVVGELGIASWALNRSGGERTDTIIAGDTLVRIGVGRDSEVQVGWAAFGTERSRTADGIDRTSGVGDLSLAVRHALASGGVADVSAMARIELPTGGQAIGAGDWAVDLLLPVSAELAEGWSLDLAPMVSAAADEDRSGRHLAYGGVVGVTVPVDQTLSSEVEFSAMRDDDPAEPGTPLLLGLSMSYHPRDEIQFDAGCNLGLNEDADDVALYFGVARRF